MTAASDVVPARSIYPNEHDMCPACSQYGLAVIDDRGPLVTHAGRSFPCRPVFDREAPRAAAEWLRSVFEAQKVRQPVAQSTSEQLAEIRNQLADGGDAS